MTQEISPVIEVEVPGIAGTEGATFTPAVSANGVMSWSNNHGLANPTPVDIAGVIVRETATNVAEARSYAEQANTHENQAKSYATAAGDSAAAARATAEQAQTDIGTAKAAAISAVQAEGTTQKNALQADYTTYTGNMSSAKDAAVEAVNTTKTSAVNTVNSTKDAAVASVENTATTVVAPLVAAAQTSEANASTSASNAASSASAASASKTAAETAETNALSYKSSAESAATSANASKTAAAGSESSARASAESAASSVNGFAGVVQTAKSEITSQKDASIQAVVAQETTSKQGVVSQEGTSKQGVVSQETASKQAVANRQAEAEAAINAMVAQNALVKTVAQTLSDAEKNQARVNINAQVSGEYADAKSYVRTAFFGISKTAITVKAGTRVKIGLSFYRLTADKSLDVSTVGDAASRAGKDFYIYAVVSSGALNFVLSANSTVPSGYTADNSRKIGGLHCLCLSVGSVTWVNPATKAAVSHTLSGYSTGDILPASVWDLIHRPRVSPEGYAYIAECDIWMSIYLLSWSGSQLVSVYRGTIADGGSSPNWHGEKFSEAMSLINGRLPWRREFQIAAKGSNEQTSITGSSDHGSTGGWTDTAGRRMISNYGLEDCCGHLWQWLEDLGFAGGSGWTDSVYSSSVDARSYGQSYGNLYRLRGGGYWGDGSSCGSRSAACGLVSAGVVAGCGGRGASEPLVRNAVTVE